jgi:hypothetical protein
MRPRSNWTEQERDARSRLMRMAYEWDFIAGSVVTMNRVCGKKGCRCTTGEKHQSLYLAFNHKGKRTMVIIPKELESVVVEAVNTNKRMKQLHQTVSTTCFKRLMSRRRGR